MLGRKVLLLVFVNNSIKITSIDKKIHFIYTSLMSID